MNILIYNETDDQPESLLTTLSKSVLFEFTYINSLDEFSALLVQMQYRLFVLIIETRPSPELQQLLAKVRNWAKVRETKIIIIGQLPFAYETSYRLIMQAFKFFLAPINNEVILQAIESTIEVDAKAEKPINEVHEYTNAAMAGMPRSGDVHGRTNAAIAGIPRSGDVHGRTNAAMAGMPRSGDVHGRTNAAMAGMPRSGDLIDITPMPCQIKIFARVNMFYKAPMGNLHIETGVKLPALQEIEVVFPFAKAASMAIPFSHKVVSFHDKGPVKNKLVFLGLWRNCVIPFRIHLVVSNIKVI